MVFWPSFSRSLNSVVCMVNGSFLYACVVVKTEGFGDFTLSWRTAAIIFLLCGVVVFVAVVVSNGEFKAGRAHCYCASLQRTQIHMPRHASSARAKY